MTSQEIRERQKQIESFLDSIDIRDSAQMGICVWLSEVAAQQAEANERLAKIANPPMIVDRVSIPPDFSYGPGEGKLTIVEPRATLRDQFAMAAMQASLGGSKFYMAFNEGREEYSRECYKWADAMLKARG